MTTTSILRKSAVARRVGYSIRHLDRLAKANQFPRPVRLNDKGPNAAVGFVEAEVEEWLQQRIAESRIRQERT